MKSKKTRHGGTELHTLLAISKWNMCSYQQQQLQIEEPYNAITSKHHHIVHCVARTSLASSPGLVIGGRGKRRPGIHCVRMRRYYHRKMTPCGRIYAVYRIDERSGRYTAWRRRTCNTDSVSIPCKIRTVHADSDPLLALCLHGYNIRYPSSRLALHVHGRSIEPRARLHPMRPEY